jgi:nitrogen-specific signal transduction histidine kinase
MLINLYNGKNTEEYRDHYAQVVTILDDQKRIQEANRETPSITISSLQQLFQTKIESIVGTVRDKLQEDAKKDSLVMEIETPIPADQVQA